MYKTILFLFILVIQSSFLFAQQHDHEHEHDEDHEKEIIHEHQHVHEIGASISPVFFVNEEELSIAAHFHYVYNFPHTKFGMGVGYEQVFDEHKHRFVGVEFDYRPIHRLTFGLSPGVLFEGTENVNKHFALHFETVYEFEIGVFHIGPVAEFAWHPEDYHISLGVHIGLGL
jgi:hypothetical protein